jgi:uncharacterized protein (TIGR02996 family)
MEGTRQRLFQAIIEDADAEAPRLAMADWLEAQDDVHMRVEGRFIRTQIALSHARQTGTAREVAGLTEASGALLKHYHAEWTRGVEALASQPLFSRGFVEHVTMDARRFLESASELYRLAPIRHIALTNARDVIGRLAESPHLARLVSLQFWDQQRSSPIGDAGLATLVASPHLRRLRGLDVSFNDIGEAGLEALAASPHLPSLVYVNLAGNRVADPVEEYGVDGMTGELVHNSTYLPPRGQALEAAHGDKAWLHAPSRLRNYPPQFNDL